MGKKGWYFTNFPTRVFHPFQRLLCYLSVGKLYVGRVSVIFHIHAPEAATKNLIGWRPLVSGRTWYFIIMDWFWRHVGKMELKIHKSTESPGGSRLKLLQCTKGVSDINFSYSRNTVTKNLLPFKKRFYPWMSSETYWNVYAFFEIMLRLKFQQVLLKGYSRHHSSTFQRTSANILCEMWDSVPAISARGSNFEGTTSWIPSMSRYYSCKSQTQVLAVYLNPNPISFTLMYLEAAGIEWQTQQSAE